jgi:hypothetical protein
MRPRRAVPEQPNTEREGSAPTPEIVDRSDAETIALGAAAWVECGLGGLLKGALIYPGKSAPQAHPTRSSLSYPLRGVLLVMALWPRSAHADPRETDAWDPES